MFEGYLVFDVKYLSIISFTVNKYMYCKKQIIYGINISPRAYDALEEC